MSEGRYVIVDLPLSASELPPTPPEVYAHELELIEADDRADRMFSDLYATFEHDEEAQAFLRSHWFRGTHSYGGAWHLPIEARVELEERPELRARIYSSSEAFFRARWQDGDQT